MRKIIKVIIGLLGFWILIHDECVAHTDSTKHRISRVLQRSTIHLKPRECRAIETLTTIIVTFDSSAHVENVFVSDTDDCLARNKEEFAKHLTSDLNRIDLKKEVFSNGYILFVLFVSKVGETIRPDNHEVFIKMFSNLDEILVAGKELKFWMSSVEYVHKPYR